MKARGSTSSVMRPLLLNRDLRIGTLLRADFATSSVLETIPDPTGDDGGE